MFKHTAAKYIDISGYTSFRTTSHSVLFPLPVSGSRFHDADVLLILHHSSGWPWPQPQPLAVRGEDTQSNSKNVTRAFCLFACCVKGTEQMRHQVSGNQFLLWACCYVAFSCAFWISISLLVLCCMLLLICIYCRCFFMGMLFFVLMLLDTYNI